MSIDFRWSHYKISTYRSQLLDISFAIVYEEMDEAYQRRLIDVYCQFSLAHFIKTPVMVVPLAHPSFRLGAPLLNSKPHTPTLHNIPVSAYPVLEEMLGEDAILLNNEMMKLVKPFDSNFLGSLMTSLEVVHENDGLIMLGMVTDAP